MLCNALIESHFDYGCRSCYPLLSKALENKLPIAQNKRIRFWLELPPRGHIGPFHIKKTNWLPIERRVELWTPTTGIAPSYTNDMFIHSLNTYNTRPQMALDMPLCRANKRQKSTSFLGPKIWNRLSSNVKTAATTVSFAHSLKKEILEKLQACN